MFTTKTRQDCFIKPTLLLACSLLSQKLEYEII